MWTGTLRFALQCGVRIVVENNELIFNIPVKAFDHELCDALATVSEDLVHDFEERAGIIEFESSIPKKKAQEQALQDIIYSAIHAI